MATELRTSGIQMGDSVMDVSGSNPGSACRGWARIASGSLTAGFNCSSITKSGAGNYVFNFSTAMTDANYCVIAALSTDKKQHAISPLNYSTTSVRFYVMYLPGNSGNTLEDDGRLSVAIIR